MSGTEHEKAESEPVRAAGFGPQQFIPASRIVGLLRIRRSRERANKTATAKKK